MLLEQHLIQLFGNLHYLPQTEIIKHLDTFNLHRLSVISENWDQAIIDLMKIVVVEKKRTYHLIPQLFTKLVTKEQSAELILLTTYCDDTWRMLSVDFTVSDSSSLVLRSKRSVMSCSKSFTALQRNLLETVSRLMTVFPSEYYRVNVNFDHGFSLDFLKALNIEKLFCMTLKAEKVRLNGSELERIVQGINIRKLELRVNTVRNWKGGEHLLRDSVDFEDSRWMTGELFINNFNSFSGYFKKCRLTAQDLNGFFKKWKKGGKGDVCDMEFHFEKPIRLEDAVKGLNAKPWNPAVRSRKINWCKSAADELHIRDLVDGLDITNRSGSLATIHLSENGKLLRFQKWWQGRFPLEELKKILLESVHRQNEHLKKQSIEVEEKEYYEKENQLDMESIRLLEKEDN